MSLLSAGHVLGKRWRIVRPALGDEPGSEFRVEPLEGGRAGRLTLWRTLRAPTSLELARFEQLVRAGERTGHPAFPSVEDVGYDGGHESLWMVRPWWNGESLPSMLGGLHPEGLDIPYLVTLVEQLAQALEAARVQGHCHGRLRPSRLLVGPGAKGVRLCILDLGLEHFRRTHAQDWLKAPRAGAAYLAPELGETGPVPPSADVFAFGLVVRDLLATRRDGAWRGRWEPWVERATAEAPDRRHGGVTETLRALLPVLRSLPNPPPVPPENYQPE